MVNGGTTIVRLSLRSCLGIVYHVIAGSLTQYAISNMYTFLMS